MTNHELHPDAVALRRVLARLTMLLAAGAAALAFLQTPVRAADGQPRVIATTDGEVDDHSSMIRFQLYTCDFDVAGIVEVNSTYQGSGHRQEPWLENQLAAYEQVLPSLRKYNPDYPSADYLRVICSIQ